MATGRLEASNPDAGEAIGQAFPSAMDANLAGTRLIAGNPAASTAHVFELDGEDTWSQTILSPVPYTGNFGRWVAFGGPGANGDAVAVIGSGPWGGRSHLFADWSGTWGQVDAWDETGNGVAAVADAVFVGDDPTDDIARDDVLRVHAIGASCVDAP
jgi:hypothetical protein